MRPTANESEALELLEGLSAALASEIQTREIDIIRWGRVFRRHPELRELASAALDDAHISIRRMQGAKEKLTEQLRDKQRNRK